jgi:hypothetical protein
MSGRAERTYKSPRRKLVRFFEKSRDQWKAKCLEAKAAAKGLKHQIRYLEQSKLEWKTKAKELEKELARMKAQQNRAQRMEDGSVAAGDCAPAAPTDADVPNSGIRLLGLADATWRRCCGPLAPAGGGSA